LPSVAKISHINVRKRPPAVTQHIDETADEALAEQSSDPTMTDDAVEFLQIVLAGGPMKVADIEREARGARLLGDDQQLSKSKPFQSAKKILGCCGSQGRAC
jgi:hypothetical protein